MRRISAYFISLVIVNAWALFSLKAQDTLLIPLKIKAGLEVSGPAIYFSDKNIFNAEGYFAADINEKMTAVLGAGYLSFKYSQYNYEYLSKGAFLRSGVDFNLMKPQKSMGKYWAGLGVRYGMSIFSSEVPSYEHDNYWGTTSSSIARETKWGHFVEVSPGVRSEIFKNFSIGWTISLRMLLYTGTGKDLRPLYLPGYGNAAKSFSTGLNYFIVWNIPYKRIRVITKPEAPEEPEETTTTPGTVQQGTGIRQ